MRETSHGPEEAGNGPCGSGSRQYLAPGLTHSAPESRCKGLGMPHASPWLHIQRSSSLKGALGSSPGAEAQLSCHLGEVAGGLESPTVRPFCAIGHHSFLLSVNRELRYEGHFQLLRCCLISFFVFHVSSEVTMQPQALRQWRVWNQGTCDGRMGGR